MSKHDDPQVFARAFLDLWQKQMELWLREPDLAGAMLRTFQMNAQQAQKAASSGDGAAEYGYAGGEKEKSCAAGNKYSHPAASERGDDALSKLERRLAECERRVAAMERGAGGRGKRSATGVRGSKKS